VVKEKAAVPSQCVVIVHSSTFSTIIFGGVRVVGDSGATLFLLPTFVISKVSSVHRAGLLEAKKQKNKFVLSNIMPWVQRTIAQFSIHGNV
jgi:hypothetical protein